MYEPSHELALPTPADPLAGPDAGCSATWLTYAQLCSRNFAQSTERRGSSDALAEGAYPMAAPTSRLASRARMVEVPPG
jgi:hypothetical protein